MNRPTAAEIERVTSAAEKWLRRCKGQPEEGIPINAFGVAMALSVSSDVRQAADGTISWTANGRKFTAEPVRDEPQGDSCTDG